MGVIDRYRSPNHSKRGNASPFIHVVHYTGSMNVEGTLDWFQRSESRVSAHEVIALDGTRYRMVPDSETAWHCGKTAMYYGPKYPKGTSNCNALSFGYELVGVYGCKFTDAQYHALAMAITERVVSGKFPNCTIGTLFTSIVGHEHIRPRQKIDPGPTFDWKCFYTILDDILHSSGITEAFPVMKYPPIVDYLAQNYKSTRNYKG